MGTINNPVDMKATIEKVYRPDLFEGVAKEVGYELPPSAWKKMVLMNIINLLMEKFGIQIKLLIISIVLK